MSDTKSKKAIRVIMADDHPFMLAGFLAVLKKNQDIVVVGTTTSIDEIKPLIEKMKPDVAVLDAVFKGSQTTGIDVMHQLVNAGTNVSFIILSQHDQDRVVRDSYQRGAKAFITKNTSPEILNTAIERVASGEIYFTPEISNRMALLSMHQRRTPIDDLTDREREIFTLAAYGKTNPEIAEALNISTRGTANALYVIKTKLGIKRRAEFTSFAMQYDVIHQSP